MSAALGDAATRAQRLREAHRLYEQIGAPRHAERVARLLAEAAP